jgi:GDP-4-dehydro-6-deoxy-D-mannose reductase
MKVLVTGAGSFSGRHLLEYLAQNSSAEIHCTSLTRRVDRPWLFYDLARSEHVSELIERVLPDQIYHLVGANTDNYQTGYQTNVQTTRNIFDSIARMKLRCRVFLVGSSAEYGIVDERDNPVDEDHALTPMSNYGLTKVYQTYLMKFYCVRHNLDIVMARTFNLYGTSMSTKLFVGRLHEQIEAYRAGKISAIVVGKLDNKRDYVRIEVAVRAYALIMERGKAGEVYNVGSGASIRIRDLLRYILEVNGLSMAVVQEQQSRQENKFDIKNLVADIAKLRALKGGAWPRLSFGVKEENQGPPSV